MYRDFKENEGKAFVYDPDISEGTKIHCAWGECLSRVGRQFLHLSIYFSCVILKLDNLWAGVVVQW